MSDDPVPVREALDAVVRSLQRGAGRSGAGRGGRDAAPAARSSARSAGAAGGSAAASLGAVFGRWDEIVGPAVAAHVQPVRLDGPRLVVEVDDPAWATQWKFLDADLRARLESVTGVRVDTVEVRVRRR